MILSAQSIRNLSLLPPTWKTPPLIEPFSERGVAHGMSYGLSCNGYDIRIESLRIDDKPYDLKRFQYYMMEPGEFILGVTTEIFHVPDWLCFEVKNKSTLARQGLDAAFNTVAEAGWFGNLTLEIKNHHHKNSVTLWYGQPIAQVLFKELDEHTEQLYNGKYQNQGAEPVEARYEE